MPKPTFIHFLAIAFALLASLVPAQPTPRALDDATTTALSRLIWRGANEDSDAVLVEALGQIETLLQQHPDHPLLWRWKGETHMHRASLAKDLQEAPSAAGYTRTQRREAGVRRDAEADAAIAALRRAIELDPERSALHSLTASCYLIKMRGLRSALRYGDLADESLARAEALDPRNPWVYILRGSRQVYAPSFLGGDLDAGIANLRRGIDLAPNEADYPYVVLAEALLRKSDRAGARMALESALRLNPKNDGARKRLNEIPRH